MNAFVMYENIVPLLAPQDITSTDTVSGYLDLKYANRAAFLLSFGAITSATATDTAVVTLEGIVSATATETALSFSYRLSGAVGANTWGAVTTAATTGVELNPTDHDNVDLWIEVDPAAVHAELENCRFVRTKVTTPADMTNLLVAVTGFVDPVYKQTTHLSVTAASSA